VVYGQYTMAKGCSYVRHNEECLDTALSRGNHVYVTNKIGFDLIWYISHISQTPEEPYCYYKLVTNVIYNSNKASLGLLYMANIPQLWAVSISVALCERTALSHGILAIYDTPSCLIA
jgi:hypothetical protein